MKQKILELVYEGKHIDFFLMELKPKTKVYHVVTKDNARITLGIIKWYPNWRQYCWFPKGETVFEKTYMKELLDFIINLNMKHKEKQ